MSKTIHIVNHTHWDREWYFSTMDSLVLSSYVFKEAIEELSKNKEQKFCLDGQTSILEDYLRICPQDFGKVYELVQNGQLDIGPWYSQSDCVYVDGESILRNLMIGMHYSKNNFGDVMKVGYLPDSFGFNAQLPLYLNHVGINSFMSWRGVDYQNDEMNINFKWSALNRKNQVIASSFPLGYYTGQLTVEYMSQLDSFIKDRLVPSINFHEKYGNDENNILISSGYDQMNIVKNMSEAIDYFNQSDEYDYKISSYSEFIESLEPSSLKEYTGELRYPAYSRVHRSIGSVRMSIKMINFVTEQKLIRRLEPMMALSNKLGVKVENGVLIDIWKKVLESQAHDSLGGCVTDDVTRDIHHRYNMANEAIDAMENLILKKIGEKLELTPSQLLLVNTDPYPFNGIKRVTVLSSSKNIKITDIENIEIIDEEFFEKRSNIQKYVAEGTTIIEEPSYYKLILDVEVELPAMGYKVFDIQDGANNLEYAQALNNNQISNQFYKLTFENQRLNLITNNQVIENLVSLTNQGNDGDTYDFSPLPKEEEFEIMFSHCEVSKGSIYESMVLHASVNLPRTLEDRLTEEPNYIKQDFILELKLRQESKLIEGSLRFDNQVMSHRLRLKFNTMAIEESAIASIPSGYIENKNKEISSTWVHHYAEKPVNLYALDKSVSVRGEHGVITFHTKGLREYEVHNKNLYVTVLATTGQLGKPDIAWRPGRASGDTTDEGHVMIPTPLAQELGYQEFKFGISIDQAFNEDCISQRNLLWNSPSISYQLQDLNYFIYRIDNKIFPEKVLYTLEKEYSWFNISPNLIVSAIHPSHLDNKSFIIRIMNPSNMTIQIDDEYLLTGTVVNALEDTLESDFKVEPYGLLSIKLSY